MEEGCATVKSVPFDGTKGRMRLETMPVIRHRSRRSRGRALMNYFASVLYAIAVIVGGVKIAVDHWPCVFMTKGTCSADVATASGGNGPGFANSHRGGRHRADAGRMHSGQVR